MSHVFLRVTLPALKLEFNFENRHLKKKTILEFGLFKNENKNKKFNLLVFIKERLSF